MRGNKLLKLIDRFVGIPIIWFMGLIQTRSELDKLNEVGILMTAAIGDTLICSSAIRDFKANNLNVKLTLFCPKSIQGIARLMNVFDKIELVPLGNPFKAISIIRSSYFDVFIDCGQWSRINSILTFFSKSNYTIGFKTQGQFRHFAYSLKVNHSDKVHELENYRNLFGFNNDNFKSLPTLYGKKVNENKFVVFHLCPSGEKSYLKEWPTEKWQALGNFFIDRGYRILTTGVNSDRSKNKRLLETLPKDKVEDLAGKTSLEDVVDYLKTADFVVSVNTGILHMASAVGSKVVSINGPTDIKRWGTLSNQSIDIQSHLSCSPCLNLGFEYGCGVNKCMQSISVEEVIEAVKKLS